MVQARGPGHPPPPSPLPPATVSEEEQKEEVQRSVFSTLERASLTGRPTSPLGSGHLPSPVPSGGLEAAAAPAGSGGVDRVSPRGAPVAAAVPFTPITLVCRGLRYYVPDPSKGAAPGVVKDSSDPEIAGKLELLKVGRWGGGCTGKGAGVRCMPALAR